jgi:phenylpropionate dioxygenase-like ring-hydroxylating dioxygenase large terminal subunit
VQLDPSALVRGAVIAIELDGDEYVVWRGGNGELGSAPRICPHLDHDLADGFVVGDELVCPGHGWAFDGRGDTYKRNEFGRADPKGRVPALSLREDANGITVERSAEAP